jgi:hypothetical protein
MRAVLGFIAFQGFFIIVGITVLRLCGLCPRIRGLGQFASAIGPGFLAGIILVVPILIVLLVAGVPLTLPTVLAVGVGSAAVCETVARRRVGDGGDARLDARTTAPTARSLQRAGVAIAGVYAAFGALALARVPTRGDDARIWSLKGLTLYYYHGLQPEIFQNPLQAGAHPVYPLLQPVVEAVLSEATGRPQLRMYHTELWLVFVAAVWTAGYLIYLKAPALRVPGNAPIWLSVLGLVAVTGAAITNIVVGDADITGAVILAAGAVALALWIEGGDAGTLMFGAMAMAAAASTKDEDLVAAGLVLLAAGLIVLVRPKTAKDQGRLRRWMAAGVYFVAIILPWRVWLAAHHLSDSVEPPLPRALSPLYIWDRKQRLHFAATGIANQTLRQWGWLAAVFLVTCSVCMMTQTARAAASFYLAACGVIVASLLWLYTATPLSLSFLLSTSTDRVVSVFMVLAGFGTAHLLASLLAARPLPPLNEGSAR